MDYKEGEISALVTTVEDIHFTDEQLAEMRKFDTELMNNINQYLTDGYDSKSITFNNKIATF